VPHVPTERGEHLLDELLKLGLGRAERIAPAGWRLPSASDCRLGLALARRHDLRRRRGGSGSGVWSTAIDGARRRRISMSSGPVPALVRFPLHPPFSGSAVKTKHQPIPIAVLVLDRGFVLEAKLGQFLSKHLV